MTAWFGLANNLRQGNHRKARDCECQTEVSAFLLFLLRCITPTCDTSSLSPVVSTLLGSLDTYNNSHPNVIYPNLRSRVAEQSVAGRESIRSMCGTRLTDIHPGERDRKGKIRGRYPSHAQLSNRRRRTPLTCPTDLAGSRERHAHFHAICNDSNKS